MKNVNTINNPFHEYLIDANQLLARVDTIKEIYTKTQHYINENKIAANYSNLISLLIKELGSNWAKSSYFSIMEKHISYETAMEIYWTVISSIDHNPIDFNPRSIAVDYRKATQNENVSLKSVTDNLRAKIKDILDSPSSFNHSFSSPEFNTLNLKSKYTDYMTLLNMLRHNHGGIIGNNGKDFAYYIMSHAKSIYGSDEYDFGICYSTFHNLVMKYIDLHGKISDSEPLNINSDLSSYIFEKLHYAVSYQRCMNAYVSHSYIGKDFPKEYWPLYSFTKLYDTHWLSLITYMENAYNGNYEHFYADISLDYVRLLPYLTYEINSKLLLPLLLHLTIFMLNEFTNGDLIKIKEDLEKYLMAFYGDTQNHSLTYKKQLTSCFSYMNQYYINPIENKKDPCYLKTSLITQAPLKDKRFYNFNKIFSRCFFNNSYPSLEKGFINKDINATSKFFINFEAIIDSLVSNYELTKSLYISVKNGETRFLRIDEINN